MGVLLFVLAGPVDWAPDWFDTFQLWSAGVGSAVGAASASLMLGISWGRRALVLALGLAVATFVAGIAVFALLFTTSPPGSGTEAVFAIDIVGNGLGVVLANGFCAYFRSPHVRQIHGG